MRTFLIFLAIAFVFLLISVAIACLIKPSKDLETKKIKPLRKLFTSTGLSTALLSFTSTMGGLQLYIFQHQFLSAFVLSGAVQGALFGISTHFFEILKKFSRKKSRTAFIMIWILLLCFSSGFSYVGISKTAYPDDVLRNDADQVLLQYCLDTNMGLLDAIKSTENKYKTELERYLTTLSSDSGIQISEQDKTSLTEYATKLEKHQKDGKKSRYALIKGILDSSAIQRYVNDIHDNGNKDNNLESCKKEVDRKIKDTDDGIVNNKANINAKKEEISVLDHRLLTFNDTTSSKYKQLDSDKATAQQELKKYEALQSKLDEFKNQLDSLKTFIESDFQTSAGNSIFTLILSIRNRINQISMRAVDVDNDALLTDVEAIYAGLLQASASNDQINQYNSFKSKITQYAVLVEQQQILESEIQSLNEYDNMLLLGQPISDNTSSIEVDPMDNSSSGDASSSAVQSTEDQSSDKSDTTTEADTDKSTTTTSSNNDEWKIAWANHLSKIQIVLKNIPSKTASNATISNNNSAIPVQLSKPVSEYLNEISDIKRLYLTDINDFDRAWSLLFSDFHPMKYKLMLFVSLVIAFSLDLVSFAMGCILSKVN